MQQRRFCPEKMAKRIFDLTFAVLGLAILSPMFIVLATWIKLDSAGPVFFRQDRVGRGGNLFRIHKFRTMTIDEESPGLQLTIGTDKRVTRSGRFLRKWKLDELAQLFDILRGDMSFVGPRPEVPKYVAYYPDDIKEIVLSVRPGITDFASIEFKDESEILSQFADPERAYIQEILPVKLHCYRCYVEHQSLLLDLMLIAKTCRTLIR